MWRKLVGGLGAAMLLGCGGKAVSLGSPAPSASTSSIPDTLPLPPLEACTGLVGQLGPSFARLAGSAFDGVALYAAHAAAVSRIDVASGSAVEMMVDTAQNLVDVAADPQTASLYLTDQDLRERRLRVLRTATNGSAPEELPFSQAEALTRATELAFNQDTLFLVSGAGLLGASPASAWRPRVLRRDVSSFAIAGDSIFTGSSEGLFHLSRSGEPLRKLNDSRLVLGAHGGYVYYAAEPLTGPKRLERIAIQGGAAEVVLNEASLTARYAFVDPGLYFTEKGGLYFADTSGRLPTSSRLIEQRGSFDEDDFTAFIAVDESKVYWLGGLAEDPVTEAHAAFFASCRALAEQR